MDFDISKKDVLERNQPNQIKSLDHEFLLLQLYYYRSNSWNHTEKSHCPLIDLCSHYDLWQVCSGQCREQIPDYLHELVCDYFPLLVNIVQFLQKLCRGKVLELFFNVCLNLERMSKSDCNGYCFPYDSGE